MDKVMIAGAGKIGSLMACLLVESGDYEVFLADQQFLGEDVQRLLQHYPQIHPLSLDIQAVSQVMAEIQQHQITAVLSSLPFYLNTSLAQVAKDAQVHYFDLTEDTSVTESVKTLAKGAIQAFVPQCGLAPGFVGIAAHHLMASFDECHEAKLRVGALPMQSSHALQYALTWSTDGLINEYANLCPAIEEGRDVLLEPLEDLEAIQIDGCLYEAFNTSGGLGSLIERYRTHIRTLNYKTIRYPGHCDKIRFLMKGLGLNQDRSMLKAILERSVPKTYQDVVVIYISVTGLKKGVVSEQSLIKKIYPQEIGGILWSAIQVSTASSICAIVDMVLKDPDQYQGFILQEQFALPTFLNNRFGQYYA